ncbi:hypothetical protein [Tenggerimyces flavus]|uniref:Uncharacterized protein n=1 Tax=Tenggerimyces flavus TaxID=1708749 RepID=A0ABV7YF74_9ACTN|nr:hypothetical protein [Tenggerimyces flavus]MBM7791337.1 hypothetical protein [Tenggerimyces flavus]
MSPLLRPVGPLPASVYWVRRALALALVGLATWLLISVLPFGAPGSGDAAPPAPTPGADRPVTTTSPRPSASTSTKPAPQPKPTAKPKPKPKPTGTPICPDSVVSIAADAKNSKSPAGKPVLIEVELENTASVACRVTVDAKSLQVTVTSGKDQIWTTEHCVAAINPGPFTLQAGKVRTLGIVWMGERSKKGCPTGQQKSLPGFYAVDASFNGIAAKKGHFLLD